MIPCPSLPPQYSTGLFDLGPCGSCGSGTQWPQIWLHPGRYRSLRKIMDFQRSSSFTSQQAHCHQGGASPPISFPAFTPDSSCSSFRHLFLRTPPSPLHSYAASTPAWGCLCSLRTDPCRHHSLPQPSHTFLKHHFVPGLALLKNHQWLLLSNLFP